MNRQQHMLMQILQKIRVFDGLEIHEAQTLLSFAQMRQFAKAEVVYNFGDPSDDMLVLIKGRLKVMSQDGKALVDIPAGASTGEMGLFTGMPRSATIIAAEPAICVMFLRTRLRALMDTEVHLKSVVLQNVVDLLAERLADTDRRLEEQMRRVAELEETQ
ncbi:MAG: signal-transduction protein with cAMP-binding, CBS, and nucleotidyltransferase domain [Candidatus Latescibacterota bacterium]|jgi:signal-transduction protein with cAMP-binding, CBS, and nucleotidyltransferase domain